MLLYSFSLSLVAFLHLASAWDPLDSPQTQQLKDEPSHTGSFPRPSSRLDSD